jgi:hypothetical protein
MRFYAVALGITSKLARKAKTIAIDLEDLKIGPNDFKRNEKFSIYLD